MPRDLQRSIYSTRLIRGHLWYDVDAGWGVLDGVHIGITWQVMIEPLVCGGDAALCQITLTLVVITVIIICVQCS